MVVKFNYVSSVHSGVFSFAKALFSVLFDYSLASGKCLSRSN